MASPVGHSLIGMSIYYVFLNRFGPDAIKAGGIGIIGAILLANLPDGDFVFGLLVGDPDRFHGRLSHSLVFAFSVAVMLAFFTRERISFSMQFWFCFLVIVSHDMTDYLSSQSLGFHSGDGVALFYLITSEKFASPFSIFYGVRHNGLDQLLSLENVWHVVYEICILSPGVVLLAWWSRNRLKVGN